MDQSRMVLFVFYDTPSFIFRYGARFKLRLRPRHMVLPTGQQVPPLPLNKTIVQVFGDFLRYLCECTRSYIKETHASGTNFWDSIEGHPVFVLTHPNGWEGLQQTQMRSAAIYGGLIPDTAEGRSRLQFVTEGEASLHYCIGNNYASDVMQVWHFFILCFLSLIVKFFQQSGNGVIIVDAGGGTIDLSAYHMKDANWFEEIAHTSCKRS